MSSQFVESVNQIILCFEDQLKSVIQDADKYVESGIFVKPSFTQVINCKLVKQIFETNNLKQFAGPEKEHKLDTNSSYVKEKTIKLMRSLMIED